MKIKELQNIFGLDYDSLGGDLLDGDGHKIDVDMEHVVHEISNSIDIYNVAVCEDGYLACSLEHFEIDFLAEKVPHDIYSRHDKMKNFFIKEITFIDCEGEDKIFDKNEVEILENWIEKHNETVFNKKQNELLLELDEEIEEIREQKKWELFELKDQFSAVQ